MESLYLLIPLSALLVLAIIGVFGWALFGGQFDDLDGEAERILTEAGPAFDAGQGKPAAMPEQSRVPSQEPTEESTDGRNSSPGGRT